MAGQPSTEDLQVQLQADTHGQRVEATVHNRNPTVTYTILRWDSVLDQINPLNKGTMILRRTTSGEVLEGPGLMVNRMLPPQEEDLVELAPGSKAFKTVELRAPWLPNDGEQYSVQAQEQWRAVWSLLKQDITADEAEDMSGPEVLQGSFESNVVCIKLSAQRFEVPGKD